MNQQILPKRDFMLRMYIIVKCTHSTLGPKSHLSGYLCNVYVKLRNEETGKKVAQVGLELAPRTLPSCAKSSGLTDCAN
jgi:hypothetical protein